MPILERQTLILCIQPIIGLATSVTLLLVAIILTQPAKSSSSDHDKLGTPGVLQLTWLLSDAEVDDPDPQAGKRVKIASLLKRKLDNRKDPSATL